MIKFPKNNERFSWTTHIKSKMMFYHISQAQINRIFRHPERIEEGIAPNTVAAMKTRKRSVQEKESEPRRYGRGSVQAKPTLEEIWIMYQVNKKGEKIKDSNIKKSRITMISAWRYPGKTKTGERPQIPEGLLDELKMEGLI